MKENFRIDFYNLLTGRNWVALDVVILQYEFGGWLNK